MKRIFSILSLGCLLLAGSCARFLEQEPTVITSTNFYQSDKDVQYGLNGVYGAMSGDAFYGRIYGLYMVMTDDLLWCRAESDSNKECWFNHDATTNNLYLAWTRIYAGVKNANEFIAAVEPRAEELDPTGEFIAQARFLRAYYHFVLAQTWGDVPLHKDPVVTYEGASCPATPQYEVMKWCVEEIEAVLPRLSESLDGAPSKVVANTARAILARFYLFMAGETVDCPEDVKHGYIGQARELCKTVIDSGKHRLNPDVVNVYERLVRDQYDTDFRESMWEVEFKGDQISASDWSNGQWGNLIGILAIENNNSDFSNWVVNYANAWYLGSIKLWDLYMNDDRTSDEYNLDRQTDERQIWNMPPYHYGGQYTANAVQLYPYDGIPTDIHLIQSGKEKCPYGGSVPNSSLSDFTYHAGNRYLCKYRRYVEWEGQKTFKSTRTCVNMPLLRYPDVLLMFAEADNEYNGTPSREAYDCVKLIRDRAKVKTRDFAEYDYAAFRQLVRNERGRELVGEAGIRRFDLIRWGNFAGVMRTTYNAYFTDVRCAGVTTASTYAAHIPGNVRERHILFPIPNIELGVNTELKQNKLW